MYYLNKKSFFSFRKLKSVCIICESIFDVKENGNEQAPKLPLLVKTTSSKSIFSTTYVLTKWWNSYFFLPIFFFLTKSGLNQKLFFFCPNRKKSQSKNAQQMGASGILHFLKWSYFFSPWRFQNKIVKNGNISIQVCTNAYAHKKKNEFKLQIFCAKSFLHFLCYPYH